MSNTQPYSWWSNFDLVANICFDFRKKAGLIGKFSGENGSGKVSVSSSMAAVQSGLAVLHVLTNSTVGHSGDEEGIVSDITKVGGESQVIERDGHAYRVTIRSVFVGKTSRHNDRGDDDYIFAVNAYLILQIDRSGESPDFIEIPHSPEFTAALAAYKEKRTGIALLARAPSAKPAVAPSSSFSGGRLYQGRTFVPYDQRRGIVYY